MEALGGLVPGNLYRQFLEVLPVVCVDLIVKRWSGHNFKYLLIKRKEEPLKGEWWIPGGRILKNETALQAARRKLLVETGLEVSDFLFRGYYEDFYEQSAFEVPCHSVSLVFQTDVKTTLVTLNGESEAYTWHWDLPERLTKRLKV